MTTPVTRTITLTLTHDQVGMISLSLSDRADFMRREGCTDRAADYENMRISVNRAFQTAPIRKLEAI